MLCFRKALECLSALQIPYPHQCCVKKGSLILSGPQIFHWGLFSQEHRALLRRILCQVRTWQLASAGLVPGEDGGSRETKATFVFDAKTTCDINAIHHNKAFLWEPFATDKK
ncbi:hypothetical protein QQF64_022022 [Cirrhinus molitorella]|uniref:Uncharacterized protein n=1 Tax=Cirrhinus molitorella TaxID=172907 RepID=A0ABR3L6Z1_9TELE